MPIECKMGVILCGGHATRLPNKPLLPIRIRERMMPMICSSVEYLALQGVEHIILLCEPESLLPLVLTAAYPEVRFYSMSDGYKGIPTALAIVGKSLDKDHPLMVVCCDNLYPQKEVIRAASVNVAVCREVNEKDATHLSKWHQHDRPEDGRWITRHSHLKSVLALTTPWILSSKTLAEEGEKFDDIVQLFNHIGTIPYSRPRAGWADLGTEDTYVRYWTEVGIDSGAIEVPSQSERPAVSPDLL